MVYAIVKPQVDAARLNRKQFERSISSSTESLGQAITAFGEALGAFAELIPDEP
jgi:hypothetical protein